MRVYYIDPRDAAGSAEPVLAAARQSRAVIAAVFESPIPGKVVRAQDGAAVNAIAVQDSSATLLQQACKLPQRKRSLCARQSLYRHSTAQVANLHLHLLQRARL